MSPFAVLLSLALTTAPILLGHARQVGCDISNIPLPPLPSPLAPPPKNSNLSFISMGFGTQNYTCGSAGNFTNVGAYAELFDISCFAKDTSFFVEIPKLAIDSWESVPSNLNISKIISTLLKSQNPDIFAQHYFVPGPSGVGLDAKWDATSQSRFDRNPHAFVLATKVDQAASPDGNQNIDWVYLKAIDGDLARQVYRTNTQLGQPPAKCTPGSPEITVKYAAVYYFFDSTLQQ